MKDKNGRTIVAGDTLFNPFDSDGYHVVIEDDDGNLFLGDYDSPLARFAPSEFWEIIQEGEE